MLHGLIGAIEDREQEDGSHSIRPLLLRHRMKAFAFCLGVRGSVSLPVRETPAIDALKSNCRTFPVGHLAGVPLEIPFRKVARQMGFADRMMCTEYRAQEAETALCGIDVNEPSQAYIFISAVKCWRRAGAAFRRDVEAPHDR